ncbi:MAG: Coenzyme F420 hydrogenase/dehydrogenase, beta subunit C-terminal domain [Thermodesulfobacteriota bacterium]|nr:Coenzyme F420 hydrogenase/dehydrogenase, beta subunit C-terminal domain [Thermodesulfobacteriota bacterium]
MQLFGSKELLEDVIHKNLCIGCGACVDLCPYIRSHKGRIAMLFPCTLEKGRCWAYCPKVEVDLEELSERIFAGPYKGDPLGHHRAVKIARAGNAVPKGPFQAGGAVSALMSFALKKGHISGAVLTGRDGFLPVPRMVTDAVGVFGCSSSKYTAAPTLSALNRALREGYERLGVVATPCQTMAIAQMRGNPTGEEDFTDPFGLVVGLFCTWALDFSAFEKFIPKYVDKDTITKMDIPPPPSEIMEIFTENDRIEIPLKEVRELVPNTCAYCTDMTSEFSDISVGVLEGRPDMNTIIIRTEKGDEIVNQAQEEGYLIVDDIPGENLNHLVEAALNKKRRAFMKSHEEGLLNNNEDGKRSCLRAKPETVEKIIN